MAGLGVPELLIILVILVLVLGPKRLPGLGKQIGTGMREFKDSITGKDAGEDSDDAARHALPEAAAAPAPPVAPPAEPAAASAAAPAEPARAEDPAAPRG